MDTKQIKDYSILNKRVLDKKSRLRIAKQILTVIKIHLKGKSFKNLQVLDVGCSSGIITAYLASHFASVIGIDTDKHAINQAIKNFKMSNTKFLEMNATDMNFPNNSFDLVICNQVYCNLEEPKKLAKEVFRVLKRGGICFLGASNKYQIWENQYNLPFLSFLPLNIAKWYLKIVRKKPIFIFTYLSFWQLEKLWNKFLIHHYTTRIIHNPTKFAFTNLKPFEIVFKFIPINILEKLEPFIPNFIWVLEKKV